MPPTHTPEGRFAPGNRANPGGRPAVVREFRQMCQEWVQGHGWAHLLALTDDKNHDIRLRAIELVYGYAYGRPSAHLLVTGLDQFGQFIEELRRHAAPPAPVVEGQVRPVPEVDRVLTPTDAPSVGAPAVGSQPGPP